MTSGEWIDVTVPLRNGVVEWPGTPPYRIERLCDVAAGDPFTASTLAMTTHPGTHVDAPLHFIAGGASLDEIPLDALVGPARVIHIADPERVTARELESFDPRPGERLLLRTRNSDTDWPDLPFSTDYVHVDEEAARLLAERGVRTVGVDHLSVGPYENNGRATHLALLGAGICVIEGLRLRDIAPGEYDLICLPLRLVGADAGPARALLRPRGAADQPRPGSAGD